MAQPTHPRRAVHSLTISLSSSGPDDDRHDHIGSNGSTPTGIATPQPDPADKRLPSIMHNYFQVGSFSGDKASLPRLWSCLSKPDHPPPEVPSPGLPSSFGPMERDDGLPTPPHSLLQQDEAEGPDQSGGSLFTTLKNYLSSSATVDTPSRRQTSLPVSSISDDPVLASHFSNPSLPPEACALTEALLLDHEKPNVSISSENLAKLTDGACLKNTPPLTPRAMSNEAQSTERTSVTSNTSVTSAPQPTEESNPDDMDSSTDEITLKLDEAFPAQTASSPQNGPPVGPLKGKLFVKISEGRGLRPSFDPYVVCVFEWNEYISKGARDDEQEKKRRQIESDAEAGRPMAIPMKSRQSSHNSALDGPDHHKGKMPVTDPHWSHEAVLYVFHPIISRHS